MHVKVRARLVLLICILATIGCDQITKHIAMASFAGNPTQSFLWDTVRFTYAENMGGFMSLGTNLPYAFKMIVFTVASGIMLAGLVLIASRSRWTLWPSVGLGLFTGGVISNWTDYLIYGQVVDFLNIGIGWLRTGIFNVADVAILFGFAILLLRDFLKI